MSVKLELLETEDLQRVEIEDLNITATINVTKFTEASVELPIGVINLPEKYTLKAFPENVTVKYNVAFTNYEKVTPNLFKAVVDYSSIKPGSNKLKVILTKQSPEIRAVKLYPEKVEYIIRKD